MARLNRAPAPISDEGIEAILDSVRKARNFDFRNHKRATLRRRIERRMADRKCGSLTEYAALLHRQPAEYDALLGSLLIKVTSFFRDPDLWNRLSQKIVPQLLAEKRPGEKIRVWSAGCATGEEAYTLAMLLAEAMGASFATANVKVFGTDADEAAVMYPRHGVYTKQQVEGLPKRLLDAWLTPEGDKFAVKNELRRAVVFGVNNLVSDAPISRLDLLVCRNVFIYLDGALQKRVRTRFNYAPRESGFLVLGKSELIPFASTLFDPVDLPRRVYRKDGRRGSAFAQARLVGLLEQETAGRDANTPELHPTEQFHRDVLHTLSMPVLTTALDGTVLSWNAAATRLWGRAEAEVQGKRLTALNLPGLSGELLVERTAAVRHGRSAREVTAGIVERRGEPPVHLSIEVMPLRAPGNQEVHGFVYVVHDVTPVRAMQDELRKVHAERQNAAEELHTINEELQSTNEELETTNEELQSTNAELDATNRELASRTEEMNRLTSFQRTIIRSIASAVVVLDPKGRVAVWNLAAERLLGLSESEAVGQQLWTLRVPSLTQAVLSRLRKAAAQRQPMRGEEVEYELHNGSKGFATVALVPIVENGDSRGSVLIFDDTTRLHRATLADAQAKHGRRNSR